MSGVCIRQVPGAGAGSYRRMAVLTAYPKPRGERGGGGQQGGFGKLRCAAKGQEVSDPPITIFGEIGQRW